MTKKGTRATPSRPVPHHNDTQSSGRVRQPVAETRDINWYEVYQFTHQLIERLGPLPLPGTLRWREMSNHNPRKLAGCLLAATYWAVSESARQDTMREAGEAVWGAADWGAIHREMQQRRKAISDGSYVARRPA